MDPWTSGRLKALEGSRHPLVVTPTRFSPFIATILTNQNIRDLLADDNGKMTRSQNSSANTGKRPLSSLDRDLGRIKLASKLMPDRRPPVAKVKRIPRDGRVDVTRAEFNRVIDILNERGKVLIALQQNQEIQFKRMAQMQAELDEVHRSVNGMGKG
jgi:hypothetical protein